MDVATGAVIQPQGQVIHFNALPDDQMRVSILDVLPGCEKFDPPMQPLGSERELELGECPNWPMLWPKSLIRVNAPEAGGSAPPNPADKVTPPAPPVLEQHVEPADEPSSGHAFMEGLEPIADVNIDEYGPTAEPDHGPTAEGDDMVEETRRAKRRLFEHGRSSQDTPDVMPFFTQDQRPDVLTPSTLLNATVEGLKGELVPPVKKGRKRHPARKKACHSQPAPQKVVMEKIQPKNLMPIHVLGQPILPKQVLQTMSGSLVALHDSVLYEEERLMREENPSYPLWIAKVPRGFGFVDTNPGDAVFLRFDDIFEMFHMRRIPFSLVRLFTLSTAIQVAKEQIPGIAIMDPFYMTWNTLNDEQDRPIVTQYIEGFFSANKDKDFCVIPYLA